MLEVPFCGPHALVRSFLIYCVLYYLIWCMGCSILRVLFDLFVVVVFF